MFHEYYDSLKDKKIFQREHWINTYFAKGLSKNILFIKIVIIIFIK